VWCATLPIPCDRSSAIRSWRRTGLLLSSWSALLSGSRSIRTTPPRCGDRSTGNRGWCATSDPPPRGFRLAARPQRLRRSVTHATANSPAAERKRGRGSTAILSPHPSGGWLLLDCNPLYLHRPAIYLQFVEVHAWCGYLRRADIGAVPVRGVLVAREQNVLERLVVVAACVVVLQYRNSYQLGQHVVHAQRDLVELSFLAAVRGISHREGHLSFRLSGNRRQHSRRIGG